MYIYIYTHRCTHSNPYWPPPAPPPPTPKPSVGTSPSPEAWTHGIARWFFVVLYSYAAPWPPKAATVQHGAFTVESEKLVYRFRVVYAVCYFFSLFWEQRTVMFQLSGFYRIMITKGPSTQYLRVSGSKTLP